MSVDRLILTDFRNHADTMLRPRSGFVVLSGDNGAGKTNILEALSLLAPGRGLRRSPLGEMARQGGPGCFGVAATIGEIEIGTGTQADAPERRIVRINGATATAGSLAEHVTMLWLTPAMDRLFTEPPSERRRLLDRLTLALSPAHAHHSSRYEAAMRERNRLLSEAAEGRSLDGNWVGALESRMAEHGTEISAARSETILALDDALRAKAEGPFVRAGVAFDGWSGSADLLLQALKNSRRRDMAAGRALIGPHRGDLHVTHLDKQQPAHLCSTGEQKALLLTLVLAHAELVAARVGRAPILLLDEIAAHLDPMRRAALFTRLAGRGQVWMTGTEPGLFAEAGDATHYGVHGGTISAL